MLANNFHIPIQVFVIGLLSLAILVSCFTVIKLKNIMFQYTKLKNFYLEVIALVISYITIFNFMYIENLYFAECFVMALSILLFTLAANILINRQKNSMLVAAILVTLGVLCYQGTISFFIALSFVLSILNNKNDWKQIVADLLKVRINCLSRNVNRFSDCKISRNYVPCKTN